MPGFWQFFKVVDIFLKTLDPQFFDAARRLASAEGRSFLGGSRGWSPQEIFKIKHSKMMFPVFLEHKSRFPSHILRNDELNNLFEFIIYLTAGIFLRLEKSVILWRAFRFCLMSWRTPNSNNYWLQSTGHRIANDQTKHPASGFKWNPWLLWISHLLLAVTWLFPKNEWPHGLDVVCWVNRNKCSLQF